MTIYKQELFMTIYKQELFHSYCYVEVISRLLMFRNYFIE